MNLNQLGKSDIYVSDLTLGCMSLGSNTREATKIINQALDAGINHLDTADLYDFGENEKVVGAAIKEKRDQLVLTTKVGNHFNKEKKDWFWDPSKKHIKSGLKDSLRRLQTDYIDFYMLHGGTMEDPISESIEAFEELKTEGLIRAYGISSIRPNVIREYVNRSTIDAVMMQYSLLDRRPEEILDFLHENHISVLARGPLAKGMLSNDAEKQIQKKGQDGYLDYTYEELYEFYENISKKVSEKQTLNTMSLQYVLKHPAVSSAVFGASSVDQVDENISIKHSKELTDETSDTLKNITKNSIYANHR
ncbi:aryl-alcohol dehydrogenase-like predicted oxidoreductase [Virgibacillus natechei]|uniref:Aryl-alcohol dehydrogenase-like predicted oxidoreductase n=1 Tax=Virgibacillus natechei TaxID=1216297 RepID=A0ABS4IFF3_9BACI|nr:aldo/keto reductase [Virgibacillus natechei]MBP1969673.1 aryl-alcohol dehydrogenase-like predicted oxidoreductase [Virgibacillus natechei]UZD11400.1 aldo/keto reductase [Virgibacillus natechei]